MTKTTLSRREFEKLSAYLDGQLSAREKAQIEKKLQTDTVYKDVLNDLKITRSMLRSVPLKPVRRNYTLTPQMVGVHSPEQPRLVPVLRYSSMLAGFLVVASLILEVFALPLLGTGRVPMMQEAMPEAAFALEADEELRAAADEKVVVETPMIIQWGGSGFGEQAEGKGGGGGAGAAPMVEAPLAVDSNAEAAPKEEMLVEEAQPVEEAETAAEEAEVEEAPVMEEAVEELDVYPTPGSDEETAPPEATVVAEALEGDGLDNAVSILGLPDEADQGMMIVPESAAADEIENRPRASISLLRIVQIGLAIFAICGAVLTIILKRKGRS